MSSVRFETSSADETRAVGRHLASLLPVQAVISLIGNLGAGKTTLTGGIVEGLGAASSEEVNSPTYTLIHEYGDPVRVYHVDLYRLDTLAQVEGIGLDELFDRPAITLIEWADRFPAILPPNRLEIEITYLAGERRSIEVRGLSTPVVARPTQQT
jgi:tRNA threonylcarbamoyladenosine biosynthesis protein TsaE